MISNIVYEPAHLHADCIHRSMYRHHTRGCVSSVSLCAPCVHGHALTVQWEILVHPLVFSVDFFFGPRTPLRFEPPMLMRNERKKNSSPALAIILHLFGQVGAAK